MSRSRKRQGVRSFIAVVIALALLGGISSVLAFLRWARAERALREAKPLPSPGLAPVLSFGLAVAALVIVVVLVSS